MLHTGINEIDTFFENTLNRGYLLDIFGKNSTGKTQLLFQIICNEIKNGNNVLYIDTNSEFRPERILEILKDRNLNSDLLKKISVHRVFNTSEQINSTVNIKKNFYSLIAIDNITDLFSYEYSNEKKLQEKNQLFSTYISDLSKFSIINNIPIVMTNMIREFNGNEYENMSNILDQYTHVKIHLSKLNNIINCNISLPFINKIFLLKISNLGLEKIS